LRINRCVGIFSATLLSMSAAIVHHTNLRIHDFHLLRPRPIRGEAISPPICIKQLPLAFEYLIRGSISYVLVSNRWVFFCTRVHFQFNNYQLIHNLLLLHLNEIITQQSTPRWGKRQNRLVNGVC
jgi:hypothetical protein